jgi:acetyltransferase-like isoleucine patch superfamily enzyme
MRSDVAIGGRVRLGPRVRIEGNVMVREGVEIGGGTSIFAFPDATVEIGPETFIASNCLIAARERIQIGAETRTAELVTIRDHDHDPDHPPRSGKTLIEPIRMGDRVWIGAKATITRGTVINDDAVVGANSVVTHDVGEREIVGGVPARLIRRKSAT